MSGSGYKVYLQALIDNAQNMRNAATQMDALVQIAKGATAQAAANALGVIGQQANFPHKYMNSLNMIISKGTEGSTAFEGGAQELIRAERGYAAKDNAYAKQFNIMDDGSRPNVPAALNQPKPTR